MVILANSCSGGIRWVCCWKWEDLLVCSGPAAPEPVKVFHCVQGFRQPLASQHMAAADVNSLASDGKVSLALDVARPVYHANL